MAKTAHDKPLSPSRFVVAVSATLSICSKNTTLRPSHILPLPCTPGSLIRDSGSVKQHTPLTRGNCSDRCNCYLIVTIRDRNSTGRAPSGDTGSTPVFPTSPATGLLTSGRATSPLLMDVARLLLRRARPLLSLSPPIGPHATITSETAFPSPFRSRSLFKVGVFPSGRKGERQA